MHNSTSVEDSSDDDDWEIWSFMVKCVNILNKCVRKMAMMIRTVWSHCSLRSCWDWTCLCDWQRDGTLSAGRSAYINYCGILQQFVQAYISKQQVKDNLTLNPSQNPVPMSYFSFSLLISSRLVFLSSQSSAPWKGALCGEAQTLLELYATQNDLSPFLQDLA